LESEEAVMMLLVLYWRVDRHGSVAPGDAVIGCTTVAREEDVDELRPAVRRIVSAVISTEFVVHGSALRENYF
jgi:hypothetical protein